MTAAPATATTVTTIATRVAERAAATPDATSLLVKDRGIWRPVTWAAYWDAVQDVAHGLLALGLEPGDRVAIHSENRPEWLYTDLACVALRAVSVGLYPTNPPAEVLHLLRDSGARVLVAEDQEQVDKALAVANELPGLERVVYVEPRGIAHHYDDPRLLAWSDLLALGREHRAGHPDAVAESMSRARSQDVATLIYTSGTTGPPKGAMLTVGNVEFAVSTLITAGGFVHPPASADDVLLSYLPLCHVVERTFTTWHNAAAGVQVAFAESVDTVQANLREIQPTILFGVPRIWEKVMAGIQVRAGNATPLKRALQRVGFALADRIGRDLERTGGTPTARTRVLSAIGHVLVFRALRDRVGMRKVRFAVSGAAPIAPEVLRFFTGIGVPVHEAYGMTENCAVATANRPGRVRIGTVGEPHDGVEVRVDETTGEVLTRHAGVFAGYWGNPTASAEAVDADGWLHTGDVGEWVDGTHLRITDRMKDVIITAGGKNVSPSEIENALKASPYVKEALVVGDRRPYLVALVGVEADTVGDWAQRRRLPYTTYADLTRRPEVVELVRGVVADVNSRLATVEQVKRFHLMPKELDHEDGELTATQKVKRAALVQRFADEVEAMYATGRES
ncbi:AMP-dependent synthetase/ligase [Thalassiella azotivora]